MAGASPSTYGVPTMQYLHDNPRSPIKSFGLGWKALFVGFLSIFLSIVVSILLVGAIESYLL